jgi:hypothetical protein
MLNHFLVWFQRVNEFSLICYVHVMVILSQTGFQKLGGVTFTTDVMGCTSFAWPSESRS